MPQHAVQLAKLFRIHLCPTTQLCCIKYEWVVSDNKGETCHRSATLLYLRDAYRLRPMCNCAYCYCTVYCKKMG